MLYICLSIHAREIEVLFQDFKKYLEKIDRYKIKEIVLLLGTPSPLKIAAHFFFHFQRNDCFLSLVSFNCQGVPGIGRKLKLELFKISMSNFDKIHLLWPAD